LSDRAIEFLDRWEADHVEVMPQTLWEAAAPRLAALCQEDAARAGIPLADLQQAAGGDLVQNMLDALNAAADRAE
jgi:hypothetical protein